MIDNERKDGTGAYRHYRKRHSGHLAVIVTALFMLPAFFLTMSVGEFTDAMYFQEIPVRSVELPAWPVLTGFAVSFMVFGAVSMRCLNPDYGKVTLRKIIILLLALLLCTGILLGGMTIGTNMTECYTEDGLLAVNREEILVYTWDDVAESWFESGDGTQMLRFVMNDGEEYVYGTGSSLGMDSDGFCAKFPDGPVSYMKYVCGQLAAMGKPVNLTNET